MSESVDFMVLCAGLGTRLRPLTLELPKPAVPFLNRPLIGRTLALAQTGGAKRVVINTHWLPDAMVEAARAEARPLGIDIESSHEPEILGTGGGLWQARSRGLLRANHHVLVLNGDVLSDPDLRRLIDHHLSTGALATMVLRPMPEGGSYTPIETDASGRIVRIGAHGQNRGSPGALFTGAHILSPEALALLPAGESSVIATVYAPLLERGALIQSIFERGLWLDLGDPAGYLEAHLAFLRKQGNAIATSATVASNATIVQSAIGDGAQIEAGATVRQSVVWPGARVPAGSLVECSIVTPRTLFRVSLPGVS